MRTREAVIVLLLAITLTIPLLSVANKAREHKIEKASYQSFTITEPLEKLEIKKSHYLTITLLEYVDKIVVKESHHVVIYALKGYGEQEIEKSHHISIYPPTVVRVLYPMPVIQIPYPVIYYVLKPLYPVYYLPPLNVVYPVTYVTINPYYPIPHPGGMEAISEFTVIGPFKIVKVSVLPVDVLHEIYISPDGLNAKVKFASYVQTKVTVAIDLKDLRKEPGLIKISSVWVPKEVDVSFSIDDPRDVIFHVMPGLWKAKAGADYILNATMTFYAHPIGGTANISTTFTVGD